MSCVFETILASVLPLIGPDFALYKTPLWQSEFERVLFPMPVVCDASSLVVARNGSLSPSDTEAPIVELETKLRQLPGIETRVLVSRKGAFVGHYVQILRKRDELHAFSGSGT